MNSQSQKTQTLVLASTSERRREILSLLQIPFEVISPLYEEKTSDLLSCEEEVLLFSIEKARSLAAQYPHQYLVGSDTLIECEGEKIGKPKDLAHAREILKKLRGKWHTIFTGLALIHPSHNVCKTGVEKIRVKMKNYSDAEIESYLAYDQPLDKAGAYALQGEGRRLIEKLEGDYLAAVGFPLRAFAQFFSEEKMSVPVDVEAIYQKKEFMNWREYV